MKYNVFLVEAAELDILDIYNYVANYDSQEAALELVENLEHTCETLANLPNRGQLPIELESAGVYKYRQIHYKAYRITDE